jgi:hypothetical protein
LTRPLWATPAAVIGTAVWLIPWGEKGDKYSIFVDTHFRLVVLSIMVSILTLTSDS